MKRKIDITKVNNLLEKNKKTPRELAKFINYPITNLTLALGKKHNRTLPMDYLLGVSDFLQVSPIDITVSINENISSSIENNQYPKKGKK